MKKINKNSKVVLNIEKEYREEAIIEKRGLILGCIFSTFMWIFTLNYIFSLIEERLELINIFVVFIFVSISFILFKWIKRDFMYLKYEVIIGENSSETKSEKMRFR